MWVPGRMSDTGVLCREEGAVGRFCVGVGCSWDGAR